MVYALINKETLKYICDSKRVSTEYLFKQGRFIPDRFNRWLDPGDSLLPTIKQAKKIASILHIPFAGLYMNPEDVHIKTQPRVKNFRTLWDGKTTDDSALNIAMLDVLDELEFLTSAKEEYGEEIPAFCMAAPAVDSAGYWAKKIRDNLGVSLEDQYRCRSSRQFYLYLRDRIEAQGVFVNGFTDVPVEMARGFAIYDSKIPVIGINDDDRPPAKSFSMIHELVHVLKRESSLCNEMYSQRAMSSEEVFCNAVAGEFLVPEEALNTILHQAGYQDSLSSDDIEKIAKKFSVSREVIIRRLLDMGKIDETKYNDYALQFKMELEHDREEQRIARQKGLNNGIPQNISRKATERTSTAVCKMLYRGFVDDIYSKRDIASHLGINQKHVDKFLMEVARWSN